mgnify:FL=1|jgi:hypothetical protein
MAAAGFENFLSHAGKLADRKLPPVDQWSPAFCGDIDIRVARNGSWYHEGRPFLRQPLVNMLSSILKREGDEYFLVSPVEKMRIQVEDVPFIVVGMTEQNMSGELTLVFRTLTDDIIPLDAEHSLRVQTDELTGEPRPYIQVRSGMEARIHRPVFYELVERGREVIRHGESHLMIESAGLQFDLGRL